MKKATLLICSVIISLIAMAQVKNNVNPGVLKGKPKDSVYNFMLTSATVAVYRDTDSSLIQFTLPDNLGEFTIPGLPIDQLLKVVISHVGYKPFSRKFTLTAEKKLLNLGLLYMNQLADKDQNTLGDVVVKSTPPVTMNGDTVEFNADAFRMDVNATAEDLMRRLPGFTVWGDGEITYNGKKINAVLVEGKPFMGSSDPTIATQNLPKQALDKIQVYQQRDEKNPLDSTMFANIKLKEDKKMGYFGKISGGAGTDKRYAADGMMSGFNKKLQLNAVGALNNINKMASTIDILMKSSSFKGEGASADYQSDFNMRGLNKPVAAGAKFQYDFIPETGYRQTSRLNADYFLKGNNTLVDNLSFTNTFLEADTILTRRSAQVSNNRSVDHKLNNRYVMNSEFTDLVVTTGLTREYDKSLTDGSAEQEKTGLGIVSNSTSRVEAETQKRRLDIGVEYTNRDNRWNAPKRVPGEFTLGYRLAVDDKDGFTRNQSILISQVRPGDNKEYDRIYDQRDYKGAEHEITASYPGLTRLIFNKRSFGGIQMGLTGAMLVKNEDFIDKVIDKETGTKEYLVNNYLSNNRDVSTLNFKPALSVSKQFSKGLTNRYNKWLTIFANFRTQYFNFDHKSQRAFQNVSYGYTYFIPDANIEYYNHQYGEYEMRYNLSFSTVVNYPDINQIAPLIDSSNLWYIPVGNLAIKPQYKKDLRLSYAFTSRTPKNQLRFDVKLGVGQIDNSFADSSIYDKDGVKTVYTVNIDGNKYLTVESNFRKSYEIRKNTTLEANGHYSLNSGNDPQYINSILNTSLSKYHNLMVYLGFRHKEIVNVKAETGLRLYRTRQEGFNNNRFNSKNSYSRLITTVQFPKNLVWSTNLTYNKSTNNNSDAVYFTIWNASLTYRFLKGNRAEVKISALDILRQNKGVVNTASVNSQTFTTSNVLQQYYMFTLSYYPRKFGKKAQDL